MHLTYELINQENWFNNCLFDHQSSMYLWHLLGSMPLQLYLLRMFCSSAQVLEFGFSKCFFNLIKSLIKCEKLTSCLIQYSKKNIGNAQKTMCSSCIAMEPHYFKILLFLLCGFTLINSKMLLTFHYFLTLQFQTFTTFTNLIIGISAVSNPTFFFFFFFFFWDR